MFARFQHWVLAALVSSVSVGACLAQAQPKPGSISPLAESLRRFLQTRYDDTALKYVAAFPDLNGDGKPEAIVHLVGRDWCGSGGCITLILAQDGGSWRKVTGITITRPPIRVLRTKSKGWRSISVWVGGGGILTPYEAELAFDGKSYPGNPSMPPARHLAADAIGEVVVSSSDDAIPLYP